MAIKYVLIYTYLSCFRSRHGTTSRTVPWAMSARKRRVPADDVRVARGGMRAARGGVLRKVSIAVHALGTSRRFLVMAARR